MPPIKFKIFRRRGPSGLYKWYGRIELPVGATERVFAQRGGRGAPRPVAGRGVRRHDKNLTLPVTAPGKTKEDALANAASLAEKIASNPFMQSVMPPGTNNALAAAKLAKKYGPAVLDKLTGKGAKRVASFFKGLF